MDENKLEIPPGGFLAVSEEDYRRFKAACGKVIAESMPRAVGDIGGIQLVEWKHMPPKLMAIVGPDQEFRGTWKIHKILKIGEA